MRLLPFAILIALGLSTTGSPVQAQYVPLEAAGADTWTVAASYLHLDENPGFGDPVVRGSRHLMGARVQYGVSPRLALELVGAGHVAGDGFGFGVDLIGLSLVHALRPMRSGGGADLSAGYTLGWLRYEAFDVNQSASAELWSKVRLFGDADRNVTVGGHVGGWYVWRPSGRSTDLSGGPSIELTVRPVTLTLDWLVESSATFSFDDALGLGLSFRL